MPDILHEANRSQDIQNGIHRNLCYIMDYNSALMTLTAPDLQKDAVIARDTVLDYCSVVMSSKEVVVRGEIRTPLFKCCI